MDDSQARKNRVMKSIEKYLTKQEPRPQRKNEKPEAAIEAEIYRELIKMGWSIDYYESSTFGLTNQYMDQKVRPGHSDLGGNTNHGVGAYVEVKDTGKRNRATDNQIDFLTEKINTGCFAVVADSVSSVLEQYYGWLLAENKKEYLIRLLPKKKIESDSNPFEGLSD